MFNQCRLRRLSARLRLEVLEDRLTPNAYLVSNTSNDSGVANSLPWAVTQANSNPGADSISFDTTVFAVPRTITLASSLVLSDLSGQTMITGPGASLLSVSGNDAIRVFLVNNGVSADLSGLTITHGRANIGGGIFNGGGTLTLSGCTLADNSADIGGGIFNDLFGTLTLSGCTLADNSAPSTGGGIFNERGTVTLSGCTLADNSATSTGGGIFNDDGTLMLTGCTLAANSATFGAGIYNRLGTVTLSGCTLADNSATSTGGGIFNDGTVNLRSSIVASNTAPDSPDVAGVVTSRGFNLIQSQGTSAGYVASDQLGLDPLLAPLGDYGGPTLTFALLPGSPALDNGDPTDSSLDQRGVAVQNDRRDTGAFESRGFALTILGGDAQQAIVGQPFAAPLVVVVAARDPGVPVASGKIVFQGPGSGPSIDPASLSAVVAADGTVSVAVTADSSAGSYDLVVSPGGALPAVTFALTNLPATPPGNRVVGFQIDDGHHQRSMVRSLTLTFQSAVTQTQINELLARLSLTRDGGLTGSLTLAATLLSSNQVKIIFAGTSVIGGPLADGRYTLQYDGDDVVATFHRLFGDLDGDADADSDDAPVGGRPGSRWLSVRYHQYLDYTANGLIDSDDREQFNLRVGRVI